MENLRDLLSGREMNRISPTVTVLGAVQFLLSHKTGTCAVFEGQKLVGVFSERDLLTRVVAQGKDPNKTTVAEVMTKNPATAKIEDSYDVCLLKMTKANCRHLPVFEGDRYAGMVSMRDLMNAHAVDLEREVNELRAYVTEPGRF
jgi:signal-transduction protein with cAMP-binding, CBS, and nucleotidyltransferase domain